jgi:hypothetical protein
VQVSKASVFDIGKVIRPEQRIAGPALSGHPVQPEHETRYVRRAAVLLVEKRYTVDDGPFTLALKNEIHEPERV